MTDIPGNSSTNATVAVGGSVTSSLETLGDHDWFAITLTAGQPVVVTVNGQTLVDPYLYIRDSSGALLYSNDDIIDGVNRNSQVAFSPSYTGTYYIDVGAFEDSYTGTYQVSVQPYTPPPLATNDQIANQLTSGYWGGDVHHFNVTQGGTITVNISTLTAAEQNLARMALQEWSDIIGVHFQEVTSGAQIAFDHSEGSDGPVAATDASWSNGIITSAHVQISSSWVNNYGTSLYSYSFQTYIHEIGHALGLGHAGDYNNTASYPYDALFQNDSWATSIMSYFDQHENTYFGGQGFSRDYAVTPMGADILAMQTLYGLSTTTRTGDTTYGYNTNAGGIYDASQYPKAAYTIFDSAGSDTLDFSGSGANQLINLNPETFSNVNGQVGNLSIARGVVIENAIGGSGTDTIIGNGAANVLKGGLGNDTLTGGGGNDTYLDTIADHNGDRITDFNAGDKLVFSNATLSSFTFSLSGGTLTYSGGSLTLSGLSGGTLVASAAGSGGVQLSIAANTNPVPHATQNDFNGDGKSDILWRGDDGTVTTWLGTANGSFSVNSANFQNNPGNYWQVAGTGDFNGDGRVDVLWRGDDGVTTNWLGQANGGFVGNWDNYHNNPGNYWHVAGIGDFNGDGRDDVLWRGDDGVTTNWLGQANGGFVGNWDNYHNNPGSYWHVAGIGDFNGDGRDDVLWRGDDGVITNWLGQANGGFNGNWDNFHNNPGTSWHVAGTGDFNGDGKSDILWRADDGTVTTWLGTANGSFSDNSGNFQNNPGNYWHVTSIGDFNGDGLDDVLWRGDDGVTTDWLGQSNGGFIGNWDNYHNNPGNNWHVQDPFA